MDISIVVPMIHEYPAIIHTLYSIQNEFSDENYTYEVIVVENGEQDTYTPNFHKWFRVPTLMGRMKYLFEPIQCGPMARMTGAKEAKGKYLMFMDAHTELGKNTIPLLVNLLEEKDAGEVHGVTLKSHIDMSSAGGHYQLFNAGGPKLNSHFHGSYCRAVQDQPYIVGGASLAYVMFNREEFLKLHGYHSECRFYPHPEGYLPLKYWMFEREVWLHPRAFHFHSIYPRNYGSKIKEGFTILVDGEPYRLVGNDNLLRNAMICAFTLGGKEWSQKIYDFWLPKIRSQAVLSGIKEDAERVAAEERNWILNNATYTLNEVLIDLHKRCVNGVGEIP